MVEGGFQRLRELFDQLSALGDEEREAEIDRALAAEPGLAGELRAMLAASERAGTLLDNPALRLGEGGDPLPKVPGFRFRRRIGRGGSSSVYLAEQEGSGFRRDVALKLIDRIVDPAALRRVREEQRILARLEHPGIARLYDAGLAPTGQPYLAMEHVEGETILEHCRAHALPLRQRLELFLAVLDAVGYAHGEAIVHRDLKPANILVSARGEAKLLDFGIAKLTADPAEGSEEETLTLRRAMTPAYASPEQVRGDRITASSDIYSLGVVLYELLAETLPYRLDGKRFETYPDAIRGQEPEPASSAFARAVSTTEASPVGAPAGTTEGRPRERSEHRRWRQALRGDLDAILIKALRKEPRARYVSVSELASDLRRYLGGQTVSAVRGSYGYRARRFVARHRTAVAATAAALSLGLLAALASVPQVRAWLGVGERQPGRARELEGFYAARPADAETARLLRVGADRLVRFDPLAARSFFRQATARTPGSALAWDGLARAEGDLVEVGKAKDAARRARAALRLPGNTLPPLEAERLRAGALAAEERWREAIPAAEELFGHLPGRIDVGLDLVAALSRSGRTEEASTTLGRLHQLLSQQVEAEADPRVDLAEAEVANRLGEYQRAIVAADGALHRSEALGSLPFQLRAERLHGDAIARLDQRPEARRQLEGVALRADAAGLVSEAAYARLALGMLLLRTAGNDEARVVLERAGAGFRASGDRRGEIAAQGQLAVLAAKRGEITEGTAAVRSALEAARRLGDRFAEGAQMSNLLILLNWADDEAAVTALLEPTLTALRESGNRPVLVSALLNAAIAAVQRVELDRAEVYIDEAEGIARRLGSVMSGAVVDRARATLEQMRGNVDVARQRYLAASERAQRAGVWLAAGNYLSDLAWMELSEDRPDDAALRARQSIDAFSRSGDPRLARTTELVLAWVDARQGRAAAAKRRLVEIRQALEKEGKAANDFTLLTGEAFVAEALGDWRQAADRRREAIRMATEWKTEGLIIEQQMGLARALRGMGKREELGRLAHDLLPRLDRLGLYGPARELRNLLATSGGTTQ